MDFYTPKNDAAPSVTDTHEALEINSNVNTTTISELSHREITRLVDVKKPWEFTTTTLEAALDEIRSGEHREAIEGLRSALVASRNPLLREEAGKKYEELYQEFKRQLPAFCFQGTFSGKVAGRAHIKSQENITLAR